MKPLNKKKLPPFFIYMWFRGKSIYKHYNIYISRLRCRVCVCLRKKEYSLYMKRKQSVSWSTTERREIKNFPYPSVFELTGRQRLTVKRGIRNVGQFLAAEVTNPGQNESQQMFAFCDRIDKEGGIRTYSSPKESPDRVKEGEKSRMISQNPKNGNSLFHQRK